MRSAGRRGGDGGRRGARARGRSLAQRFGALFTATDSRFEYSRVSGTTALDFNNPGRTLAATAGTPTLNASSANFAGRPSLSLDGTVTLKSNQASSFFQKLTDGNGGSIYLLARRTAQGTTPWQLFGTRNPSEPGAFYRGLTSGDDASLYVTGTAVGTVYLNNTIANGLPVGESNLYGYTYSEAASPKVTVRKGASIIDSGPSTATPGTVPGETLTIGTGLPVELAAVWVFNRVLSTADYATMAAYAKTFGVTA